MSAWEALARLESRDPVLVGDGLWDHAGGEWVVGGEQRLFQAVARLAQREGFRVRGCQPHGRWEIWQGDGVRWVGVPPARRHDWRRWRWNRALHRT